MVATALPPRNTKSAFWRWVCLGKGCNEWHRDNPDQAYGLDQWRRVHEVQGHEVVLVPPYQDPEKDGWRS